ncbi:MAG: hypothetical protein KBC38_02405 [Candidatus Pacebacteria bacterium]|nr:hypothetical protein [Candidatus Paceibacterota bacterium]MBP9840623.1 hypothetical protein [Candidatus Paceibacterota bacterium]
MFEIDREKGLRERTGTIEGMVGDIVSHLRTRYGVPVADLRIKWTEGRQTDPWTLAWVEGGTLHLVKSAFVTTPYESSRSRQLVGFTFDLLDSNLKSIGRTRVVTTLGIIEPLLNPPAKVPEQKAFGASEPMTSRQIKAAIARALVSDCVARMPGWLSDDSSHARCLRNGFVSVYENLVAGTKPTSVSKRIWTGTDDATVRWREAEGGFDILYTHLKDDYRYDEVIDKFLSAGPPLPGELLPDYVILEMV